MAESTLDVRFERDGLGKVTRMNYSLIGFPSNTWFAIFLNDIKTDRIRTNVSGQIVGYLDSIPPAYDIALTCVGDFHAYWNDSNSLPQSGVVYGTKNTIFVELVDDDGENQDRVGEWSLEVRYD